MSETLPHIFLSFANDHNGAFLHALEPERRALRSELAVFQRNGWGYYHSSSSSAAGHLIDDLQLYPRQISIFHFSGHADGESLQLESQKKEQQDLHKNNLLSILKEEAQNNLQLVFLNACETKGMLEGLQELDVPAVILTDTVIHDRQAKKFSLAFYRSLLNGSTLETAFSKAKTLIASENSDSRIFRKVDLSFIKNKKKEGEIPWGLHVQDDAVLNWKLLEGRAEDPKSETKALNKIPGSHQDFVGRDKELRELRHLLQKEKPVLLLNGIGGIGKTTLARQYLHDNYFHFDKIVWVSVLSEQADEDKGFQTATDALGNDVALMDQLGIAFDKKKSAAERAGVILSRLRTQSGQNLLIIDNAGFSLEKIRIDLPQAPHWQVLITSRKELTGLAVKRLDELPPEEALELFYLHYPQGKKEAKDVEALLEHIGYHTLTLELFAKTCKISPSTNPRKILGLLQEKRLENLSRKVFVEHSDREVEVYGYLLAAFELNELSKDELAIIIQWAILPSQQIEWEILNQIFARIEKQNFGILKRLIKLFQKKKPPWSFENACTNLKKKGWISKSVGGNQYKLHQLIQEVIRYKHKPNVKNCHDVITGVGDLLRMDNSKVNSIDKFPFMIFGESILSTIKSKSEEITVLQNNLASVYKDFGKYEESKSLLEEVLESAIKNWGRNSPITNRIRYNLAVAYKDSEDLMKAKTLLEKLLNSEKKESYGHQGLLVKIHSSLGLVFWKLGDLNKARTLLERALTLNLEKGMSANGYSHIVEIKSNLALVYTYLGLNVKAINLLEKALNFGLKKFDENHPHIAIIRSHLGLIHKNLGEYDKAKYFLEKAFFSNKLIFGEDHRFTVKSKENLELIYQLLENDL